MSTSIDIAYNTDTGSMIIPEYGRHIHKIIEHAKEIKDKEERSKCAKAIVQIMGIINPGHKNNSDEHQQKLWSHLFIMADFNLNIDAPVKIPKKENYQSRPDIVPYPSNDIKYGHYGKIMEDMVKAASLLEEGENRQKLVKHIANLLKTSYLQWNRDSVNDSLIIKQLEELSEGKLTIESDQLKETSEIVKNFRKKKTNTKNYSKNKNRRR